MTNPLPGCFILAPAGGGGEAPFWRDSRQGLDVRRGHDHAGCSPELPTPSQTVTLACVPGPTPCPLVSRIKPKKPSRRMPPFAAKNPLSDRQKHLLRRWVEQGADSSRHWAFTPPRRPPVPDVRDQSFESRTPVDAF